MSAYANVDELIKSRTWEPGLGMSGWDNMSNYAGEMLVGWVVGFGQTRDSDALDRANFQASLTGLGGEDEEAGVRVARFGHWACGWIEQILVRTDATDKLQVLLEQMNKTAKYPVLDEQEFQEEEQQEKQETFEFYRRDFMSAVAEAAGLASDGLDKRFGRGRVDAVLWCLYDEDCGCRGLQDGWVRAEDVSRAVRSNCGRELESMAKDGNKLAARLLKLFGKE